MSLSLTRRQIIDQGLSLAGRTDLVAEARVWLSLFLEDIYYNQDFEWLKKVKTGISVTSEGSEIPADYRAAKTAILVHPSGTTSPLTLLTDSDEVEQKKMQVVEAKGTPVYFYVDHQEKKFKFIPEPIALFTMNLTYYHIPEIGEVTSDLCDDDVPTWGLPFSILVDHIKARAFEYNDDLRQPNAETQVRSKIAEAKANNHDRRAGPSRFKLGKRFKKRF